MEISRRFMPLLTELGGWEMDFCYKHVAPRGAPAFQRWLPSFAWGRTKKSLSVAVMTQL